MDLYILTSCLLPFLGIVLGLVCLILGILVRQHISSDGSAPVADETAPNAPTLERQYLPGNSPGYYTGDPTNDVLVVEAMDLTPNPPTEDDFVVELRGRLTEDIGTDPQTYISLLLNGRAGPDNHTVQIPWSENFFETFQHDRCLGEGEVPKKGDITMRYKHGLPTPWMLKGWYTVRCEMYASHEVGGARMTGFEGTVWVDGEASDSDCDSD